MRPKAEKLKQARLVIYLEDDERRFVTERAKAEGISISSYLRRLLKLEMERLKAR